MMDAMQRSDARREGARVGVHDRHSGPRQRFPARATPRSGDARQPSEPAPVV